MNDDIILKRVLHHTNAILRASGSSLKNYTMPATQEAILSAVADLFEEAYLMGMANTKKVKGGKDG